MAELRIENVPVTAVLASTEACDRLDASDRSGAGDATLLRCAPREVLVVGDGDIGAVRRILDEPTAVVDDVSDGWISFLVVGEGAHDVLSRLTELAPPAAGGWVQGEVARAPAKVIGRDDGFTLLVPAHVAAHVHERISSDAAEVLT